MIRFIPLTAAVLLLAACREDDPAAALVPVTMSEDALGHFCQMNLTEHPGPKAQVHLDGMPHPLFFSQVRDAIAYDRMPEQSHMVAAIFVNDMGAAPSWEEPGVDNWIPAETAFYVAGSAREGGMGAPELVPFATTDAAEAFAARHGGSIVRLAEVADADVLTPVTLDPGVGAGDGGDYLERLRALNVKQEERNATH